MPMELKAIRKDRMKDIEEVQLPIGTPQCWALYDGDRLMAIGSRQEIARELGLSLVTVSHYCQPSYQRKHKDGRIAIPLGPLEPWEK